jgi:hypothetical protein
MKRFWHNNGLSIAFLSLFFFALVGQTFSGIKVYNEEMIKDGGPTVNLWEYLSTGHFLQSTFENWESEFLQMGLFVWLSQFLYQKGSSESKDPDKKEEVDREPNPNKKGAPAAVRKGGWVLKIYESSLGISLLIVFLVSFYIHFRGSLKDHNLEQQLNNEKLVSAGEYLFHPRLWFESFQNWQSEFLSVFAIVVLSIFFREKNSPQSKPVDAPNSETG